MTDNEMLQLILEKVTGLDKKVTGLEKDMVDMKRDMVDMKRDMVDVKSDLRRLHRDSEFILDEVERVHGILEKHKADKKAHTA